MIAGEYVIILEGAGEEKKVVWDETVREVKALMEKGLGRKDAVRTVAELTGSNKKELYRRSME